MGQRLTPTSAAAPPQRQWRRPGPGRRKAAAAAGALASAALLLAVLGLAFAGYLHPDRVLDFAVLLQMCGLR